MKLQNMIDDGIRQGIHSPTVGTTLKKFQDFFCQNFKGKYDRQEDMKLKSNQPSKIHAIAKTHKFDCLENITIQNLKIYPTISQIGTYNYNATKVLPDYLKPLCQNEYKINDTQSFASQIKEQLPLDEDEECLSYDVDSLFTNISLQETNDYYLSNLDRKKNFPKSAVKQFSEDYCSK